MSTTHPFFRSLSLAVRADDCPAVCYQCGADSDSETCPACAPDDDDAGERWYCPPMVGAGACR